MEPARSLGARVPASAELPSYWTLASDRIETDGLVQPRIDPEIVLGIGRDVPAHRSLGSVTLQTAELTFT